MKPFSMHLHPRHLSFSYPGTYMATGNINQARRSPSPALIQGLSQWWL